MPGRPSEAFATHPASVVAHRARNLRVFGSVARGEDAEHSDLDLLVDTTETTSLFHLAAMELELERLLGIPVHVSRPSGRCAALCVSGSSPRLGRYDAAA